VLEFASISEGGKSRLFHLDVLVPVHRVQRADERTRTGDLISLLVRSSTLLVVSDRTDFLYLCTSFDNVFLVVSHRFT
jgi:hypothetical protein